MPDPFGDNEALSQDALDALVNSVDNAEAEFTAAAASEPAPSDTDSMGGSTEPGAISDTGLLGEESVADDEPYDAESAFAAAAAAVAEAPPERRPAAQSPLHMTSFDHAPASSIVNESTPLNGFERVQDIPLELTVELGRTKLLIKDILELRAGSIVELEKMAGEPVDILANGLLVARGEVVVIEDAFGVRITEIITSAERKAMNEETNPSKAA